MGKLANIVEQKKQKRAPKPDVYIASMNMRGKWATAPDGCKKINVTSSEAKKSKK